MFRYRRSAGRRFETSPDLNVALEGLREALRQRKATPADIARCAEEAGVWKVVRPYLEILWHAGEPLVVGRQFYRHASELIRSLNITATTTQQCIQTNGMLIDAEWCELFVSEDIRIGVSIDGPGHIHNHHRMTRSGQPTFRKVMQGVSCLRKHGVDFSTLGVLTKHSLLNYMAVLDFYESEGLHSVGFNLEEIGSTNTRSSFASQEEVEAMPIPLPQGKS